MAAATGAVDVEGGGSGPVVRQANSFYKGKVPAVRKNKMGAASCGGKTRSTEVEMAGGLARELVRTSSVDNPIQNPGAKVECGIKLAI